MNADSSQDEYLYKKLRVRSTQGLERDLRFFKNHNAPAYKIAQIILKERQRQFIPELSQHEEPIEPPVSMFTERELRQMDIGNIDKNLAETGRYESPAYKNKQAAAELANLSGFHEDRWFEYASVHGVNLNEYLERATTFKGKERNAYLNKLVDVVTGYSTDTFPPLASTASAKTSMNGGMNNEQKYTRMFSIAKQCKTYDAFCERLYDDGLFSARAPEQLTAFVRERSSNPQLTEDEADKMLETLYLGMTIALPPDEDEYPGVEGNTALRLNHLRELQSEASHPGAVAAKKIGRLMPDITAAEERKVLKSIAEKGYYEQPLEQKQAFCKKTGGHRDFIIGEQKEIDGQLRTEYKCGWCGTIEYR